MLAIKSSTGLIYEHNLSKIIIWDPTYPFIHLFLLLNIDNVQTFFWPLQFKILYLTLLETFSSPAVLMINLIAQFTLIYKIFISAMILAPSCQLSVVYFPFSISVSYFLSPIYDY